MILRRHHSCGLLYWTQADSTPLQITFSQNLSRYVYSCWVVIASIIYLWFHVCIYVCSLLCYFYAMLRSVVHCCVGSDLFEIEQDIDRHGLALWHRYIVSKKTRQRHSGNLGCSWPIFKILSLTNFQEILFIPIVNILWSPQIHCTSLPNVIVHNYNETFAHAVKENLF